MHYIIRKSLFSAPKIWLSSVRLASIEMRALESWSSPVKLYMNLSTSSQRLSSSWSKFGTTISSSMTSCWVCYYCGALFCPNWEWARSPSAVEATLLETMVRLYIMRKECWTFLPASIIHGAYPCLKESRTLTLTESRMPWLRICSRLSRISCLSLIALPWATSIKRVPTRANWAKFLARACLINGSPLL